MDSFEKWMQAIKPHKKELSQSSKANPQEDELYIIAYSYYQKKHYSMAASFFRLLVERNPQEALYWQGAAAALQMAKEYEGALDCYAVAAKLLNPPSADLFIHTADCYFAINDKESGLKALDAALKTAKSQEKNKIAKHVSFMKKRWTDASKT